LGKRKGYGKFDASVVPKRSQRTSKQPTFFGKEMSESIMAARSGTMPKWASCFYGGAAAAAALAAVAPATATKALSAADSAEWDVSPSPESNVLADMPDLSEWLAEGYAGLDLEQSGSSQASGVHAARPPNPVLRQQMMQIVDGAEQLDVVRIFAEPVTEEIAPGYFSVISRPLNLRFVRYVHCSVPTRTALLSSVHLSCTFFAQRCGAYGPV
jgi:hypothetical protein